MSLKKTDYIDLLALRDPRKAARNREFDKLQMQGFHQQMSTLQSSNTKDLISSSPYFSL